MKQTATDLRELVEDAFERHLPTNTALATDQWDRHYSNLGMDSLDHVEMIMEVEKELGINIHDEKAEVLTSPQALLDYLQEL